MLERAEMACQRERRGFADLADAERIQEARQCRAAAAVDGGDEIGRGLFTHALELGELPGRERVEIGGRAHHIPLDELLDDLVAESLDVERPAAREVTQ